MEINVAVIVVCKSTELLLLLGVHIRVCALPVFAERKCAVFQRLLPGCWLLHGREILDSVSKGEILAIHHVVAEEVETLHDPLHVNISESQAFEDGSLVCASIRGALKLLDGKDMVLEIVVFEEQGRADDLYSGEQRVGLFLLVPLSSGAHIWCAAIVEKELGVQDEVEETVLILATWSAILIEVNGALERIFDTSG